MIWKTFTLIFFLMIGGYIFSQNNFYVGIKGGPKATYINAEKFGDKAYARLGIVSGVTLEYLINFRIGFAVDILYKQVGFGTNVNFDPNISVSNDQTVVSKFNYDYLSIPIKLRFGPSPKISGKRNFPFLINLGVSYSSLLKNEQITEVFDQNKSSIQTETRTNYIVPVKNYLSGLIEFSGHYVIKQDSKWNFTLSTSYQYCFKNLSTSTFFPDKSIRYNEFDICLGINYKL